MAGPYTLPYGSVVQIPTWFIGKSTRLYVQNPDKHFPGQVNIDAAGAEEEVVVYGGKTTHIERYWGGVEIFVTNDGGPTLTVWTE